MLTTNPFSILVETVPSIVLQSFVIVMVALVIIGTLVDIIHKKTLSISLIMLKKQNYQLQESLAQVKEPLLL